jgi:hypothetical protein
VATDTRRTSALYSGETATSNRGERCVAPVELGAILGERDLVAVSSTPLG